MRRRGKWRSLRPRRVPYPAAPTTRQAENGVRATGGQARVNFEFVCGWCDEDNVLWGERTGFWGDRFTLPERWDCWYCDGTNITPDGPWTPAE